MNGTKFKHKFIEQQNGKTIKIMYLKKNSSKMYYQIQLIHCNKYVL